MDKSKIRYERMKNDNTGQNCVWLRATFQQQNSIWLSMINNKLLFSPNSVRPYFSAKRTRR